MTRNLHALALGWCSLALIGLMACGPSPGAAPAPARPGAATAAPASSAAAPAAPASNAAAPAAPTPPPALVRLLTNWAGPGGGQSGIWMTYEGGYAREQGLDVEVTNVNNTARAIQAMMQGEINLSIVEPATAIQVSLSGGDTVLLLGAVNRLPYSVMAQPAIREPRALQGKVMGITRIGSATHSAARVALHQWGLAPDQDVALRQLGETHAIVAALDAGQIDAGLLSPPNNQRARRDGYNELLDLGISGPEYVSLAVGGLRAWVAANEDTVRRYTRAYTQAMYRLKTDRAWAIEVYRKYLRTDDEVVLNDTYDAYSEYYPSVPYVSEAGVARLLEDLSREDPRLGGRPASDWVETRYVREVEISGFVQQLGASSR